jgi:hypothetical protein
MSNNANAKSASTGGWSDRRIVEEQPEHLNRQDPLQRELEHLSRQDLLQQEQEDVSFA